MVIVHAQERAGAGAAGRGAQTHHIHTFTVHPRGEERSEDRAFDVFVAKKEWEKDQSGAHGEERAEGAQRVHIFITKLMEEEEGEEEGRPSKACPGPSDLLAPFGHRSYMKTSPPAAAATSFQSSRIALMHRYKCG